MDIAGTDGRAVFDALLVAVTEVEGVVAENREGVPNSVK